MNISINSDGLTPVSQAAASLIEKLAGRPCEAAGGLLSDQIQYWRWSNRLRIHEKVDKRLKEGGIPAKELPPSFYFPLLEEAGNVDSDELQTLWANLLAKSVASSRVRKRSFVETLKRLSISEVKLLTAIAAGSLRFDVTTANTQEIEITKPIDGLNLEDFEFADVQELGSSLSLLATNGCVVVRSHSIVRRIDRNDEDSVSNCSKVQLRKTRYRVWLTSFGSELIEACTDLNVFAEAIKQPWALTDDALGMAAQAGRASMGADEVQQMIDDSSPEPV